MIKKMGKTKEEKSFLSKSRLQDIVNERKKRREREKNEQLCKRKNSFFLRHSSSFGRSLTRSLTPSLDFTPVSDALEKKESAKKSNPRRYVETKRNEEMKVKHFACDITYQIFIDINENHTMFFTEDTRKSLDHVGYR